MTVPFTVSADMQLGDRIKPFLVSENADVEIRAGKVPEALPQIGDEEIFFGTNYQANAESFLLQVPNGVRFLVQGGHSIIYDRDAGVSDREVALFLLGSAWGALCYQRDLLPLHASGVIIGNAVHAFTGTSGAGKSTLSAALADRGFVFFTDDILIVDTKNQEGAITCYSGQKDLKLWKDALEMTNAAKGQAVRDVEGFDKFFATPVNSGDVSVGHLASLSILGSNKSDANAPRCSMTTLKGGQSVLKLASSVYRPAFALGIWGRKKLYTALGDIIQHVHVQNFDRPFVPDSFNEGLDFAEAWLNAQAPSKTDSAIASDDIVVEA